jgi:hypothetical protein
MTRSRDHIYDQALTIVSAGTDVPREAIVGHSRTERIVFARHILWYIMREVFKRSYATIGAPTRHDHGSVLHGVRKLKELPADDSRRWIVKKLSQQARVNGSELQYEDCIGARVVVQEVRTGQVKEVVIDRLTKYGDGVKFTGNGSVTGTWFTQRDYLILDRL